jgi:hypothetical protein
VARGVRPLKVSRSSSAKKGLIRTETPCAEIESTVCDLVSPVITTACTFRPSVCTENLNPTIMVMQSAKDGA